MSLRLLPARRLQQPIRYHSRTVLVANSLSTMASIVGQNGGNGHRGVAERVLVIMRGAPGSGKSTEARRLLQTFSDTINGQQPTGQILSTDDYFISPQTGAYEFNPSHLTHAHTWNQSRALAALDRGISPVIIDNTTMQAWEAQPYVAAAVERGYTVKIVEPTTGWWMERDVDAMAEMNTHGVGREAIARMLGRFEEGLDVEAILRARNPWENSRDVRRPSPPVVASQGWENHRSPSPYNNRQRPYVRPAQRPPPKAKQLFMFSTTAASAVDVADADARLEAWIEEVKSIRLVDHDQIAPGHGHLLTLTLQGGHLNGPGQPNGTIGSTSMPATTPPIPTLGTPIPPAFHLAFFPPHIPERLLAPDGYDTHFAPPHPYIQRMWAGGSFTFNPHNPLRYTTETVTQTTTLDRVEKKMGGRGPSVLVWMDKTIKNSAGVCVTEKRSLVYLPKLDTNPERRAVEIKTIPDFSRTFTPTPVTLFRYSAVTFNSHLIHYDDRFAREVEGYPACLVHGPLTATLLLDLLEKCKPEGMVVREFGYRALAPLFVGEEVRLCGKRTERTERSDDGEDGEVQYELWAVSERSGLAMKGTAVVVRDPLRK
ncbi:uncharacterized protein EV422DRAFT_515776 [Fimicolochytrium jonesii]|uniref:uncharacterized protein n=1 Tax=Fimicolochytrium jonesii TaxID=1396493 RepID=UPI0022FEBCC6|nr:uncharacterized protein EV422DRAFT_515776 [Fimicolochytrium jonesii]KAI8826208.1 hypothetical protein EV422DRAFT_515776 [Fimicolochytrium jonesii]